MGYCNVHLSTKFNGSKTNHLTNDAKHVLRQHLRPDQVKNIDSSRSHLNLLVVDKFGLASDKTKTLWKETKKFIADNKIYVRNKTTVLTGKAIFGMPRGKHSDEDIAKWVDTTKEFLNEYEAFKDKVTLAVLHRDENQVHMEVFFIPVKDNKLNYGFYFGGNIKEGTKKIKNLHEEYFLKYRKLGYKMGNGLNTNGLSKKNYQASIAYLSKSSYQIDSKNIVVDDVNFFNKSTVIRQQEEKILQLEKESKVLRSEARKSMYYKEKYASIRESYLSKKKGLLNTSKEVDDLKNQLVKTNKAIKTVKNDYEYNYRLLEEKLSSTIKEKNYLQRELDILKNPEFEEAKRKLEERLKNEREEKNKENNIKNKNDEKLKHIPK